MTLVIPLTPERRDPGPMIESDQHATPEQVMGTCLRLELEAAALYRRFEEAAGSAELKRLWAAMAAEEAHHAALVHRLAMRRNFSPPAIGRDVLAAVAERVAEIRRQADVGVLDDDRMLSITAAVEFSEMDDLFSIICRSAGMEPDRERGDHLAPLVEAVTSRPSGGQVLQHLLAAMIRFYRRAQLDTASPSSGAGGPALR